MKAFKAFNTKTRWGRSFIKGLWLAALAPALLVPVDLNGQSAPFDYKGDTAPVAGEINLVFKAGKYKLKTDASGNISILMDDFSCTSSPGDPVLPIRIYNVAVPPNIDWKSVRLEIEPEMETLGGKYNVNAAPPFVERLDDHEYIEWGQGKRIVDARNLHVYGVNAYWPEKAVTITAKSQMRKWKFLRLVFNPMQYNPADRSLRLAKTAKVRIRFTRIGRESYRNDPALRDTAMDAEARDAFVNFRTAGAWYRPAQKYKPRNAGCTACSYAIITTKAIVASSGSGLADFISHKEHLGYNVILVTEDDYGSIPSPAPNQTAEKIRQWLANNYLSSGIKWALLIGNPDPVDLTVSSDTAGDVPMKMCWSRRVVGAPNDGYYSNLTGNWDLDGDGFCGEQEAVDSPKSPDPLVEPDTFSVRWTGKIESAVDGNYQFSVLSDEAVRLIIKLNTVIDNWTPHYGAVNTNSINLSAGQKNDITVEFKDLTGDALFSISWLPPGQTSFSEIPAASLYHLAGSSYVSGGLQGEYFNNEDFTSLALTRVDGTLRFFWGTGDKGEGGVDFTPDVYVGRIPVYNSNYAILNDILKKTIGYEQAAQNIPSWRKRALLPMKLTYMLGEHLKEDILKPSGFGYYRIYEQDFALDPPPEAVPCNSANVLAEWAKGYGLIVWAAHGGSTSAGGFISSSMCPQLDNTKPSFTFQGSCHNGQPEEPGNLGYSLLKHGAVTTVSASRQSGGGLGNSFTPSPTSGMNGDLGYYYAEDVVDGVPAAKALYQTIESSTYWPNNMIYNLYGDPTVSLLGATARRPSHIVVSCHGGGVFWGQDENGLCGVMVVDIVWYDPFWWIKHPYDPWEMDLQIGYNTARTPQDSSFLGKSNAISATLDLRYKIPSSSRVTPFLGAGPGLYYLGITDTIAFGFNVCVGIDFRLTPRLSLELGAGYHYLFNQSKTNFVQVTAGVLLGFVK